MTELSDTVTHAVTVYTHIYESNTLCADIITGQNAVRFSLAHPQKPGDHYDVTLPAEDPSVVAAQIQTALRQREDITLTALRVYPSK